MKTRRAAAIENENSKQKVASIPIRRSKKAPERAATLGYQDALAQPNVERQLAAGRQTAKKPPNQAMRDVRAETEVSFQAERRKKRNSQETDEQPQPEGAAGNPASKSRRKGSKASPEGKSPPFSGGNVAPSSQPAELSRLAAQELGSTARKPAAIRNAAHPSDDGDDDDAPEEVTGPYDLLSLPAACHVPIPIPTATHDPPAVCVAPLNSSVTT